MAKLADPARAWARYEPGADRPWNLELAGHLYRRAAFGATADELQTALAAGPHRTIDWLLRPDADVAAFNRTFDEYERSAEESAPDVPRAWWLRRMLETPHPLLEQMTLFWHNHFAVSNSRVGNSPLMCRYVQLLRRHALGSFAALLEGIVSEPAVLASLDARVNHKARPSQTLPRVLLEQYTLGPGKFTEKDVREAARAFTGWAILQNEVHYSPAEHDGGAKRVLGQEGEFEGKDVVRLLLERPATAQSVVRKIYRWLISETAPPPDSLVTPLAANFAKDYHVPRLVETMLRSNLFFSRAAYRQKIKSPVEFAIGIIKGLGGVATLRLGADLAGLGQDLYHPPTVRGWAGHRYWTNRFTLVARAQLAQALLSDSGASAGKPDLAEAARQHGHQTPEAVRRFVLDLFLQNDLPDEARQALSETVPRSGAEWQANSPEQLRQFAAVVTALPEFHLV